MATEAGTVQVVMPAMGDSVAEGTVLEWHKREGDSVDADETIVEISTDKVDAEVPAPIAGQITKILAPEGETVTVGAPLAEISPGSNGGAPRAPQGGNGAAPEADSHEDTEEPQTATQTEEPQTEPNGGAADRDPNGGAAGGGRNGGAAGLRRRTPVAERGERDGRHRHPHGRGIGDRRIDPRVDREGRRPGQAG